MTKNLYSLPDESYLAINRCNLPAKILGSLSFFRHPTGLCIDGVYELHRDFFQQLDVIEDVDDRGTAFLRYMRAFFSLDELLEHHSNAPYKRIKADYLRMLRGWHFDSNGREGAVIKGWVESRFGLLPRWHKTAIHRPHDEAYAIFMHERTTGIYNTNSLEAQLDLLYSYCQYELKLKFADHEQHIQLYRGTDAFRENELINADDTDLPILLMNNMSSLSASRERADEFGTRVFQVRVPLAKVFYYSGLLSGLLQGEDEFLVIGGLYQIELLN